MLVTDIAIWNLNGLIKTIHARNSPTANQSWRYWAVTNKPRLCSIRYMPPSFLTVDCEFHPSLFISIGLWPPAISTRLLQVFGEAPAEITNGLSHTPELSCLRSFNAVNSPAAHFKRARKKTTLDLIFRI